MEAYAFSGPCLSLTTGINIAILHCMSPDDVRWDGAIHNHISSGIAKHPTLAL